mgnify:CR=1 FL=1
MRKAALVLIAAALLIAAAAVFILVSNPPQGSEPPIEQELGLELVADGLVHPIAAATAPGIGVPSAGGGAGRPSTSSSQPAVCPTTRI